MPMKALSLPVHLPTLALVTAILAGCSGGASDTSSGSDGGGTATDLPNITVTGTSLAEGNSGTRNLIVTFTLDQVLTKDVSVAYTTVDGTAKAGSDYTAVSGTATVQKGNLVRSISIPIKGDTRFEADEVLYLDLSDATGVELTQARVPLTIENDDTLRISAAPQSMVEGASGSQSLHFTVGLSQALEEPITISYLTRNLTASAGSDYQAASGTLTFAAGETSKGLDITLFGDVVVELDESFELVLSGPSGLDVTGLTTTGTLINDDLALISISPAGVNEGNSGTTDLAFSVRLDHAVPSEVLVDYTTVEGTATPGEDYQHTSGTLTFPAKVTSATIPVTLFGDTLTENSETFTVVLSNPRGASLGTASAIGTIGNDDRPRLSVRDAALVEGNSGSREMQFTVFLDQLAKEEVTVEYATADLASADAARAGSDYTAVAGRLTFPAGTLTQLVRVPVFGDTLVELDERFYVTLSNPVGALIDVANGVGTLRNDDLLTLTLQDGQTVEGDSGVQLLTFTALLDQPPVAPVSFGYTSLDGSATTADGDYNAVNVTSVQIPVGQQSIQLSVEINGDNRYELDETLGLQITNLLGAEPGRVTATGTVRDDDPPVLSVADLSINEGSSGPHQGNFTLTLDTPALAPVSVDYQLVHGTTDDDDLTLTSGTLTFGTGESRLDLPFSVQGDTRVEGDEHFTLALSNAQGIDLVDASATVTLIDDDQATLSVADAAADEASGTLTFTLSLDQAALGEVVVDYTTQDAPLGNPALAGSDYGATSGQVRFAPGELVKQVSVSLNDDNVIERDEAFELQLGNLSGALPGDMLAVGTLRNDDYALLSIGDLEETEGEINRAITFTVDLDRPTLDPVSFNWTTLGDSALAPGDFTAANGQVVIPAGQQQAQINVVLVGDDRVEPDEQFILRLTSLVGAQIATDLDAVALIHDNDHPTLVLGTQNLVEGDASNSVTYGLTLDQIPLAPVSLRLTTLDGSAVAGSDFQALDQQVTFGVGEMSKSVQLTLLGDTEVERDESFFIQASEVQGANPPANNAQLVIFNDDVARVQTHSVTLAEGTDPLQPTALTFTVTLDRPALDTVTVNYSTQNGTALAGQDYTGAAGLITFAAGEVTKEVVIQVLADAVAELDESFGFKLSGATGAIIDPASTSVTATLSDDDPVHISTADSQAQEGDASNGSLTFTITLDQPTPAPLTLDYAVAGADGANGATAGVDFTAISGQVTLPTGADHFNISVPLLGDTTVEGDERITFSLSNPSHGVLDMASATGTILNDDQAQLLVSDVTVAEGDSNNTLNLTLRLDRPTITPVTLHYTTQDGTALAGEDYSLMAGDLTFNVGQTEQTLNLTLLGDTKVEHDERLTLEVSNLVGAGSSDLSGLITLSNDDLPQATLSAAQVDEGNSGSATLTFQVSLDQPAADPVSVHYSTADITALAGEDYQATSGTLTFNEGDQSKGIDVTYLGDTKVEHNESFSLLLDTPQGMTLANNSVSGTLRNDDLPVVTLTGANLVEGNEGDQTLEFLVRLDQAPVTGLSVDYMTSNGTASSGSDYVFASGTLLFAAGETAKTIPVTIHGDTRVETDETFTLTLDNLDPTQGRFNISQASATIVNDDHLTLSVTQDASVNEGDSGTTLLNFNVTLNDYPLAPVTATYSVSPGTASASSDFTAVTQGSFTIDTNNLSHTVQVSVNGDTVVERDETLVFTILSVDGAYTGITQANGTILNDDIPQVSVSGSETNEEDSGSKSAYFTVNLDRRALDTVYVEYATSDLDASAGSDYTATSGTLAFLPGTTQMQVPVSILGDTTVEHDEALLLTLSNPQGLEIDTGNAGLLILNDDSAVISVADTSGAEGASDHNINFTVSLDQPGVEAISFHYATADDSATTADNDYLAASGDVTIPAGTASITVPVMVRGDGTVEHDERFSLTLSNIVGASSGDLSAFATLQNDDTAVLTLSGAQAYEGDSGDTTLSFALLLDQPSVADISVDYTSLDITAGSADYSATSGSLTFAPGETSKQIDVALHGDTDYEADETFRITLSGLQGANIGSGGLSATGTLLNDDAPRLTLDDAQVLEGDSGTQALLFQVTLQGPAHTDTQVDYLSSDRTASATDDYQAVNSTLFIPKGETHAQVSILVNGDTNAEGDETLTLTLSNPSGLILDNSEALGTLFTDDLFHTLNDTGIGWGGAALDGNNSDCSGAYPAEQDCGNGRDAEGDSSEDGNQGFAFTKLDTNGDPLPASSGNWACVRDNVTGLVWEAKQGGNGITGDEGLHDSDDLFSWYDSDPTTNGGDSGITDTLGDVCYGYLSGADYCNTEAFVARVNTVGLCGANDWRLPTLVELHGLADLGMREPAIDSLWFPSTVSGVYWSSVPKASAPQLYSWGLDFGDGSTKTDLNRVTGHAVRLVREAQ